jgi:hypothetical protein
MTAKQEAEDLVGEFLKSKPLTGSYMLISKSLAKEYALICVNKLLNTVPYINNTLSEVNKRIYYMDVRTEINNL